MIVYLSFGLPESDRNNKTPALGGKCAGAEADILLLNLLPISWSGK